MDKRQIESGHFKVFRSSLDGFPAGEVWQEETPDFIVHTASGRLGVEHALVHLPAGASGVPPRQLESIESDVTLIAQDHAELRGMPPVHVHIDFRDDQPLRKLQKLDLARCIARICFDHMPEQNENIEMDPLRYELPREVREIRLYRPQSATRHHWTCTHAGMVMEDSRELLQEAINQKAEKFQDYCRNCSRCWLLLVADGTGPSSFIQADEKTQTHVYRSPFERTFFLSFAPTQLHELVGGWPDE